MLVDGVLEVNQDKGAIRRSLADPLDRGEGDDREDGRWRRAAPERNKINQSQRNQLQGQYYRPEQVIHHGASRIGEGKRKKPGQNIRTTRSVVISVVSAHWSEEARTTSVATTAVMINNFNATDSGVVVPHRPLLFSPPRIHLLQPTDKQIILAAFHTLYHHAGINNR